MDKQEYKLRAEEIKSLIAKRDFFNAVKIADEIDWTRVRSVAMLCTVSDLYKANRRYKESKELLLMAYERHPNGRMILYSLCELCIKMGEVVQAIEYYKEFVQLAPMDNGKYILQYKLYVAQEVSLEERIAVLEELKKRDYREKWGYELAYLYHRIGLATKCVEECDELILWFSDGRYVKKAMELKMLHQPLTAAQEASYNSFIGKNAELPKPEPVVDKPIEEQIKEPSVNVSEYNTINLQKALAESMKELLSPVVSDPVTEVKEEVVEEETIGEVTSQIMAPMFQDTSDMKEVYFEDKTDEMVPPPAQMEEIIIKDEIVEEAIEEEIPDVVEEETEAIEELPVQELEVTPMAETVEESEEVEELEEEVSIEEEEPVVAVMAQPKQPVAEEKVEPVKPVVEAKQISFSLSGVPYEVPNDATKEIPSIREIMGRPLVAPVTEVVKKTEYTEDGIPTNMVELLSQEYDGQISLVVAEETKVEKQITGQMNIEDVLGEWEKTKKEYEEKTKAERAKRVLEQTGAMFTDFEEKVRDGILEQLQKEQELEDAKSAEEKIADAKAELAKEETVEEPKEEEVLEEVKETVEETESKEPEVEDVPEEKEERRTYTNLEDTAALEKLILEEEEEAAQEKESTKVVAEDSVDEKETLLKIQQAQEEIRELNEEEKALFAPFIQTKGAKRRFMKALDLISLAAYTGNVIVTGEADSDTLKLAKNIMKDIQMTDPNFSGVIAKVSGVSLNSKSVENTIAKLNNGGLIIEKASGMNSQAVMKLLKALNQEQTGIVVILEDTKKAIKRMLAAYPSMSTFFNARIEVEELNNDALAAYGRQYAAHLEYSIDELGMLALQTQIEDRQTSEHIVTVAEVRELVDGAIANANRKNIGHFFDIIMKKRYDEEDMIILREKDFI